MWLHSLKVAQLLRSAAFLYTNQSRSYLNHLVSYGKCGPGLLRRYSDSLGLDRRGSNPGGGEVFCTRPERPWSSPSLVYNGNRFLFPEVERPGRGADHPLHLAPRLKKKWGCTSTPPLDLHGMLWGKLYHLVHVSVFVANPILWIMWLNI